MKLTKPQIKAHEEACKLLTKETLSWEERVFVLEHWHEGATHMNAKCSAFFTPAGLAQDMGVMAGNGPVVVDMCAGIGRLARSVIDNDPNIKRMVCIEINHEYAAVGRKIVPEADWVVGSIDAQSSWEGLPRFDSAITNPPFGNMVSLQWGTFTGPAEMVVLYIGLSHVSEGVTAILPQGSCPFKYSGQPYYQKQESKNYARLAKVVPDLEMQCMAVDSDSYKADWNGVAPTVELVNVEGHPFKEDLFL